MDVEIFNIAVETEIEIADLFLEDVNQKVNNDRLKVKILLLV